MSICVQNMYMYIYITFNNIRYENRKRQKFRNTVAILLIKTKCDSNTKFRLNE